LPVSKTGSALEDILDGDILGHLPLQPSPFDIAAAVTVSRGGQFFAARFGVSGNFLQQLVSNNVADSKVVWEDALTIQKELGVPIISAGVMIVALLRTVQKSAALLAHLQLEEKDLIDGIRWYTHLQHLIETQKDAPKHPGGIGRDWAFGWIPTLSHFGQNISEGLNGSGVGLVELEAHQDALDHILKSLAGGGSTSLALVGPTGVGKTEVVYALADKLMDPTSNLPHSLKYHQVFLLDASALITAAPGRGELEELMTLILNEAYTAKNIIVCLDNAQLFFEEGVGSVDVTGILLPILQAARLPIILNIDEQRYLQIAQRTPELANALNRISMTAVTEPETMAVMQDRLLQIEYKTKTMYMYQALKEAYRLSERYIYDLVMPGRALRLLESAAQYSDSNVVTANSVQQAIEKTMNVKVGVADDDHERETLLNMENLIHQRMIGQDKAVTVVSDALRRARAGVRNQNRPIGTFLFLGPTGVGKTEMAKSLAAVYFGNENQMVRLDMNEFVSPDDVKRLIADGANDAGSLTARIMKQPFSVILLDEIEKAHPSVLSTLLQLLDEGVLRDENNREVSFKDAIVIATSNANADRIREYIERGYKLEQFEQQLINELIDSNVFHPEFLNRFDDIVVFSPLNKDELMQVVDLILKDVNRTLETQKVTVTVADDAKKYLVDTGYDPRLGARPMRRIVQRAVENIVAKAMLAKQVDVGGSVEISLADVQNALEKSKTAGALAEGNK
jgi:ATP-dependent Clp protease ATP-binding subunit ClpC